MYYMHALSLYVCYAGYPAYYHILVAFGSLYFHWQIPSILYVILFFYIYENCTKIFLTATLCTVGWNSKYCTMVGCVAITAA